MSSIGEGYAPFLSRLDSIPKYLTPELFHYTSSEAAILGILANRSIRMSSFTGMNDLWESRPMYVRLESVDIDQHAHGITISAWNDADRYIRRYSKVACFTQDWVLQTEGFEQNALRGWARLSMWAHYGDNHRGVCLRFDRNKLMAAFKAAEESAFRQFSGPVQYCSLGPEDVLQPISLDQAAEFGMDVLALRHADKYHQRIFFRKHTDWASESEFRLVRTDLSTDPYYLDISDALTGVILGEKFPVDQIAALRTVLADFEGVEVFQTAFLNRVFYLLEKDLEMDPEFVSLIDPNSTDVIVPRRSGDLKQRMRLLEDAEQQVEQARQRGKQVAEPMIDMWEAKLLEQIKPFLDCLDLGVEVFTTASAIPSERRQQPPGVEGEAIAYETGLQFLARKELFDSSWSLAVALQIMPNGDGRLYASIQIEERSQGCVNLRELYRDSCVSNSNNLLETSVQMMSSLVEAIPSSRAEFDRIRGD